MTKPDLSAAGSIGEAWLSLRQAFRSARIASADFDARLLVTGVAGLEPHQLVTEGDAPLTDAVRARLIEAVVKRLDGMPVHRILGIREFYGLPLKLSAATLEPRPDTETLVDAVLPFVRTTLAAKGDCSIADLGIGTGAIGLALVAECAGAHCLGVDVSDEAVDTALENAASLGLSDRYRAVQGDWLTGIDQRFDLIVSNPPYIAGADLAELSREVVEHDPTLALYGGPDGLDAYRAIAEQSEGRLAEGGMVALEIGIGQRAAVADIFSSAGFQEQSVFSDLGGVERAVLFNRRR